MAVAMPPMMVPSSARPASAASKAAGSAWKNTATAPATMLSAKYDRP